jgi:hypothetical protein
VPDAYPAFSKRAADVRLFYCAISVGFFAAVARLWKYSATIRDKKKKGLAEYSLTLEAAVIQAYTAFVPSCL